MFNRIKKWRDSWWHEAAPVKPFEWLHFSCPFDGGDCNNLMCEQGPSSCAFQRNNPFWRMVIFRGGGCE